MPQWPEGVAALQGDSVSAFIRFMNSLNLMQQVALLTAAAALVLAAVTTCVSLAAGHPSRPHVRVPGLRQGLMAVLLLGTASAVIHVVLLCIRTVQSAAEFVMGHPWIGLGGATVGPWGVISLFMLLMVLVLALACTRNQRLATCVYWNLTTLAVWAVMLLPVVRPNGAGGFSRTGSLLLLISSLSVVLGITALTASRWMEGRSTDVQSTALPAGLSLSVVIVAVAVGLLAWCQILTPIGIPGQRAGFQPIAVVACLGLSGLACWRIVELTKCGGGPADAVLGLFSLCLAGLATVAVPRQESLAEYFPVLLNALTVGFSAAACGAGFLAISVRTHHPAAGSVAMRTLAAASTRFVFLNGVIAFLSAMMMGFWPRLPGIAAMDDSYGRVISGFAANFLLLLIMLWVSRRLNRIPLHVMTVLVLCSAIGFVAARVLPFASHVN